MNEKHEIKFEGQSWSKNESAALLVLLYSNVVTIGMTTFVLDLTVCYNGGKFIITRLRNTMLTCWFQRFRIIE